MEALKRNEIQMPQDFEGGKDKIVFGNILQIYEWHKTYYILLFSSSNSILEILISWFIKIFSRTFSPELEKCLTDCSYIGQLFVKYVRKIKIFYFSLFKIDNNNDDDDNEACICCIII